ncbi:putative cleavage and polyadenylation specificity factor subunit 2 [Carpediemonas membranifera]|uniref:Cleavage and polyadenylation specificity factor subunit 2 n=1 Tax=Carpediemonas membranifera TaxID=201153 RepID=A0A8J6B737_9EUKA|nr:putative cleavage and polyadenylation specificity factor subunit 2 [Carpediemonas membranifera]|eukprot:KAG9394454.1 putative cleavage and polyadenylation specificity factor subunit 2 [Carpediemonas membranifera]
MIIHRLKTELSDGYLLSFGDDTARLNILLGFSVPLKILHPENDRQATLQFLSGVFPREVLLNSPNGPEMDIHLIILPQSTREFVSGLPVLFPFLHRRFTTGLTRIVATQGTSKLMSMTLYDIYASYLHTFCQYPSTDRTMAQATTLDIVDALASHTIATSFNEQTTLEFGPMTVTLEPVCAGGEIGRAVWVIALPSRERFVYMTGVAMASDGLTPVCNATDPAIHGAAYVFIDPRVTGLDPAIPDAPNYPLGPGFTDRGRLDYSVAQLCDLAATTLAAGNDVLVPTHAPTAMVDLLRRLDAAWGDVQSLASPQAPSLVFLSPVAHSILSVARASMGFMASEALATFHNGWTPPLPLPNIRVAHDMAELRAIAAPRLVVGSMTADLHAGLAHSFFLSMADKAGNLVVLPHAPDHAGSVLGTLHALRTAPRQNSALRVNVCSLVPSEGKASTVRIVDTVEQTTGPADAPRTRAIEPTLTADGEYVPFLVPKDLKERCEAFVPPIARPMDVRRPDNRPAAAHPSAAVALELPDPDIVMDLLRDSQVGLTPASVELEPRFTNLGHISRLKHDGFGALLELQTAPAPAAAKTVRADSFVAAQEERDLESGVQLVQKTIDVAVRCQLAALPLRIHATLPNLARALKAIAGPGTRLIVDGPGLTDVGRATGCEVLAIPDSARLDVATGPVSKPVSIGRALLASTTMQSVGGTSVGRLKTMITPEQTDTGYKYVATEPLPLGLGGVKLSQYSFGRLAEALTTALAGSTVVRETDDVRVKRDGEEVVVRYQHQTSTFIVDGPLCALQFDVQNAIDGLMVTL